MTKAKRWKPKEYDAYWTVDLEVKDGVSECVCYGGQISAGHYRLGNCFKTKREAQAVARKLKGFWKNVREGRDDRGKSVSFNRDS